MGVEGRVAVVTGAASGMGRATAVLLAEAGATVALCDINSSEEVARSIRDAGGKASVFEFDAESAESVRGLAAAVLKEFGGVDILVNNAGIGAFYPLNGDDATYDDVWRRVFAINVDSQQRLTRHLLPALKASPSGRVVNIASTEGLGATIFNSA